MVHVAGLVTSKLPAPELLGWALYYLRVSQALYINGLWCLQGGLLTYSAGMAWVW